MIRVLTSRDTRFSVYVIQLCKFPGEMVEKGAKMELYNF